MATKDENLFRLSYQPTDAEGECVLIQVQTIKFNTLKFVFFCIFSLLTLGVPVLICHWFSNLKRILYYDLAVYQDCSHVAIINYDEELTICQLVEQQVYFDDQNAKLCRTFVNRYMKYIINQDKVVRTQLFDFNSRLHRITTTNEKGLNDQTVQKIRSCYGKGTMQIEQPQWYQFLIKQLLRPLYMFQLFSVILWYVELYYIYASIILGTSTLAIAVTVYQLLKLNQKIYHMAYYEINVNTLRNGKIVSISSLQVVPGDIVFLKDQIKIPFEGIILEGSALINQCALTGQSVPIVKKADVSDHYKKLQEKIDKAAYVFQGTTIIQVNSRKKMNQFESTRQAYGIPVCVTRTNFVTLKGQLIRIILFPKEQDNIFQRESAKFLFCLFFIAIITYFGMINHLQEVVDPIDIFIKFLDLIVITVPPALPVSMAMGVIYAIDKLKDKSIFCIEQNKVITGGAVTFSCFDKTGTLTEDFMDFEALIPAEKGRFYESIKNRQENKINVVETLKQKPYLFHIFNNMASNHSIIRIEETGEMIGDPMEIKLFQFGEFTLNQSNSDPQVIVSFESTRKQAGQVFRRFEFDSDLQRMSVVTRINDQKQKLYSYAKGSPEMMKTILEQSSIPRNYDQILKQYTSNGFRVLAIGSKPIQGSDYKSISRDIAETGLIFNGFQVFENKLKPQTKGAIKELKDAKIGVVMITGDNPLTGANIGYKCGISFKDKGMIICDYKGGKFTEEDFILNEQEENAESNGTFNENSLDLAMKSVNPQYGIKFLHDKNESKYQDNQTQMVSKAHLPELNDQTKDSEAYMRHIINLANSTNCQLCVTGNAFNHLFEGKVEEISDLKRQFLECTTVYARTKPNDKAKIVMVYQHTGRTVSMCGDGANDCGALKQADIGLSLSQAQASISAPFTSQIANISSMVELLKECRAGLATNFSLFNIMASYSLTQYTTSIIQQLFYSYAADFDYMFWDIACNFFFIVFVGYTATADKLSIAKPNNSLICFTNLFQVLFAFALNAFGQIIMIVAISQRFAPNIDYYNVGGFSVNKIKYVQNEGFIHDSPQANVLFLFSNFMYLFTVVAFCIGQPWKKSFYTNKLLVISLLIVFIYCILVVVVPATRWDKFVLVYMNDDNLNGFIVGIAIAFGLTIFLLQKLLWEPLSIWLREKYPEKKWL